MKVFLIIILFTFSAHAQTRFAMIGDYGCDEPNELNVSQLVKAWDPEFIVTLGDNNYYQANIGDSIDNNIGKYYHEYIYPYLGQFGAGSTEGNRFFPALGNHDLYDYLWFAPDDIRYSGHTYYGYFLLTDLSINKGNTPDPWSPAGVRYYTFKKDDIEFFMINSGTNPEDHSSYIFSEWDGVDSISVQAQWFKNQMKNSTAKWKIVVLHHPPYMSIAQGFEDYYKPLRWNFKEWGATTVVSGHLHSYESLIIDGLPYFINGLGGEDKNPSLQTNIYPGSRFQYVDKYGAMFCTAYADSMIFSFKNTDNEIIDTYRFK